MTDFVDPIHLENDFFPGRLTGFPLLCIVENRVTILTDIPDWTRSTAKALERMNWKVEVVDVSDFHWTASKGLSHLGIVFNRIAARPMDDDPALLTRTRDLLAAVDLAGLRCLNGSRCHAIGASKVLQASLFASLSIPAPWTRTQFVVRAQTSEFHFDRLFLVVKHPGYDSWETMRKQISC